jgi:hypothetical protein
VKINPHVTPPKVTSVPNTPKNLLVPLSQRVEVRKKRAKRASRYFEGLFPQQGSTCQPSSHTTLHKQQKTPALSRSETNVNSSFEPLQRTIQAHISYKSPSLGIEVNDQPKYDSCTRYDINESQEKELWTLEAERLLEVVKNDSRELKFDGQNILGRGNKEGFENLDSLTDQILCNFMICIHDYELLALEHWPTVFHLESYRRSKGVLTSRFDLVDPFEIHPTRRTEQPPKILQRQNVEAYCALVDYITAVIAKFAMECAVGDFWQSNCLAVLAKWATKLKVVVRDPVKYATVSLESANDLFLKEQAIMLGHGLPCIGVEISAEGSAQKHDKQKRQPQGRPMMNEQKEQAFAPEEDQAISSYFVEMSFFRSMMAFIFIPVLRGLRASSSSGFSAHAFEISSLVYGTGFSRAPTILSQDRHGEIAATSASVCVQNAYAAFNMTLSIAKETQKRYSAPDREPFS